MKISILESNRQVFSKQFFWALAIIGLIIICNFLATVDIYYVLWLLAGVLSGIIIYKPFIGMLIYVFGLPFEALTEMLPSFTILKGVGILTFLGWTLKLLIKKEKVRFHLSLWPMTAYIAVGLASSLWVGNAATVFRREITIIQLVVFFLLFYNIVKSQRDLKLILYSYTISCLIAAIFAFRNFLLYPMKRQVPFLSYQNSNFFPASISVPILFMILLVIHKRGLKAISWFVAASFGLFTGLISQTRTFMVSLLASISSLIYFSKGKIRKTFLVLAIFVALVPFMPRSLYNRAASIPAAAQNPKDRGTARLDIWLVSLNIVKEHPLIGIGLNNFREAYLSALPETEGVVRYKWTIGDAHNIYLHTFAELGAVGLAVFMSIMYIIGKGLVKALKQLTTRSMKIYVELALVNFVFTLTYGVFVMIHYRKFFWFGLALAAVVSKLSLQNKNLGIIKKRMDRQ